MLLVSAGLSAADRFWISASSSNWNNTANWSTTSGGSGGASVPGGSDRAVFNGVGGRNGGCTVDVSPTVDGMLVTSGYSGTFNFGSATLSCSSNADFSGSGAITVGTGTLAMAGASGTQTLTAGSATLPPITHATAGTLQLFGAVTCVSFTQSAGVFDANGKALTTTGNLTVNTGTTTTMAGLAGASFVVGGNASFNGQSGNLLNLHPGVSTGWTVTATGTLTASYATVGKSNASGGTTGVATNSVDAGGNQNWSFGSATWYWNPSTAPLAAATRSEAFTSTSLDSAWTFRDNINEPVYSNMSLTANAGKLTINGRGGDIWGGQFGYVGVHRSDITGDDFDVSVYVASQTNTDSWAKAGILATNSVDTPSLGGNGAVFITPGNGAQSHWAAGASPQNIDSSASVGGSTPCYLRLTRSGISMTAYYKKNLGDAWTQIGSSFTPTSTASGTSSKIAIVSCAHTTAATCTTVFDDFTASNSLPNLASAAHWTANQDGSGQHPLSATDDAFAIGALDTGAWSFFDRVTVPTYGPGSVAVTGGAVAITSEGWHMIDDVRDEFAGIKRADITGDFDVSVQVVSQVGGTGGSGLRTDWALSGLVIANDFTNLASGGYCGIMATTGQGIGVTADGNGNGHLDSLSIIGSSPTTRPTWLRLTRKGSVIKGYYKTSAAGAWSAGTTISPVSTATNLQIALVSCGVQTGGTYSPIVSTFDDFQGGGTINGQDANLSFNGSSATKSSSGILGAALSAAGIDCTGANNFSGTLDFNGKIWSDYGNANFVAGGAMAIAGTGGGTLAFRGTAAQTLTPKSGLTFPSIQQNGSGGTTLATNDVTVSGNVTITSGTLNAGGRNITLGGNWSNSGTFTPSTGTVTFASQGTQTITGNTTFNNLTATPFFPTQLSGCSAWYDAADTGSVTASSGNLTQWLDKAGGNYHLVNINTPRYNDKTLNSLPVVTCPWNAGNTGQGHSLWTSSFAMTGVNTTIFMVHRRVTGTPNSTGVLVLHSGGGANNINLISAAAPLTLNVNQSEGLNIDITQPAIDAWGLTVMRRQDGTGYLRSSNTSTLVEGYDAYTPGTSLSPDRLTLNTKNGLDGAGINDFAEVILYNRALSTSEQAQVESYLGDKWGLGTTVTRTMQFAAGSTQTVNGILNLQGSAGNLLTLRSSSTGSTWILTPNGTRTCSYVDVQDGINTLSPTINPASSTNSGNTTKWFYLATDRYWIAGSGANWNNTANWSTASGGAGGASVPTTTNDVYFDASGLGTCTVDTTPTILLLNMAIGYTGALVFGTNTVTVAGSADLRSGGTFTGTSGGLTISATGTLTPPAATTIPTLTVSGGITTLATNVLSVAGNLTISGGATLTTGGKNISVAGNWANSGTFIHGSATATLNGAGGSTQVISGSTTFNNLTATAASARTLQFTAGTTQTVASALTFTGASGQLLSLTSTTNGVAWNLDPQGTRTCSYLSVRDGNNTRKPVIGPTYSSNVSGNTWWFTQGLSVAWGTGTTGVTAGATSTITWNLGNVLQAGVRTTHTGGSDALDFTVLNGSDVGIVLTATGANSTDWTLAALPGADQCVVGVNTDASATYSSLHAGGVILNSGLAIGAEQSLDLKFIAPVTTTKAGTAQTVSVTLTATAQ